ncbi:unnamed protein product [Orchesella dallaii]|uniref:Uncharacterized protein n=1 Tax=Orchesella dallaii TaxID=48710 RepID=A0ABP1RKY6_9HEXA
MNPAMDPLQSMVEEMLLMRNYTLKWEELVTRNLMHEIQMAHHVADMRYKDVWYAIMDEKRQHSLLPLSLKLQEVIQLDELLHRIDSTWNLMNYGVNNLMSKIMLKRSAMVTLSSYLEDEERLRSCHVLDFKVLQSDMSWKVMNSATALDLMNEWDLGQKAGRMCQETLEILLVRYRLLNQRVSS